MRLPTSARPAPSSAANKSAPRTAERYRAVSSELIGIATTCLTRDHRRRCRAVAASRMRRRMMDADAPRLVHISTPSYRGTHIDGFHAAVRAVVEKLATPAEPRRRSHQSFPRHDFAADLRYLKEVLGGFRARTVSAAGLFRNAGRSGAGRLSEDSGRAARRSRRFAPARRRRATVEFGRTIVGKATAGSVIGRAVWCSIAIAWECRSASAKPKRSSRRSKQLTGRAYSGQASAANADG